MNNFRLVGFRKYVFFFFSFINNIAFIILIIAFLKGNISNFFTNTIAETLSINIQISSLIFVLILISYILWSIITYMYFFKKNLEYKDISRLFIFVLIFSIINAILYTKFPYSFNIYTVIIDFIDYSLLLILCIPFISDYIKRIT